MAGVFGEVLEARDSLGDEAMEEPAVDPEETTEAPSENTDSADEDPPPGGFSTRLNWSEKLKLSQLSIHDDESNNFSQKLLQAYNICSSRGNLQQAVKLACVVSQF